jgi:orotate phosphoribosyltransferase
LQINWSRSEKKSHGLGNKIEGKWHTDQKAVVIEDLISTGKSSKECICSLQEVGIEVLGVLSIFSYNLEKANLLFNELNIPTWSLCDYPTKGDESRFTRFND